MSVKSSMGRSWKGEKNKAHQALVVENRFDYNQQKSKENSENRETYPPLSCSDEEFHAILDTMFIDRVIKPPRPSKVPSREDRKDPRYFPYHQHVEHPSIACQTLRNILYAKICERTLEFPCKKQAINTDLLLKCREKDVVIGITCSEDNVVYHPWNNGPSHMRPFESLIGIGKKLTGASTPSLRVTTCHCPKPKDERRRKDPYGL